MPPTVLPPCSVNIMSRSDTQTVSFGQKRKLKIVFVEIMNSVVFRGLKMVFVRIINYVVFRGLKIVF